jgi:hypothetical protein
MSHTGQTCREYRYFNVTHRSDMQRQLQFHTQVRHAENTSMSHTSQTCREYFNINNVAQAKMKQGSMHRCSVAGKKWYT